ncbi:diguanylate cyclase [Thalassotalea sp. LPB0316]|uniref:GGDEF domain-containing protein n=1 Tax=Thalassotalea sp. LPB0316 TaxID=2769490 RepID=UPI0018660A75|nr:sensor domain-containing diguanylate cyclase [Thalassotalea sp. LPB0316]QOL25718.1 diguanylate cyclase [Thalassotalea sp. LPB0316]
MTFSFCEKVTDQLNSGILVLDLENRIVFWNNFMAIHANKKLADVFEMSVYDVFPELPRRWFERKLEGVKQLNSPSFCSWEQRHHLFELPHTRPITTDSHYMAQNITFTPVTDNGELNHICILIEDVTDVCHYQTMLRKTLDELAMANRIDGLTQIFNRKHWEECLGQEFSRARRYDADLALIMFDLDHFKRLNDTYGHQCGDTVLIETSKSIDELIRISDTFGRYGGEEFAVILPETGVVGALDVAEKIRQRIEDISILYKDTPINITASIGIATLCDEDYRYEDLISKADQALYQAKDNGRNQVSVYQNMIACV